jgi:hypothetical protein
MRRLVHEERTKAAYLQSLDLGGERFVDRVQTGDGRLV